MTAFAMFTAFAFTIVETLFRTSAALFSFFGFAALFFFALFFSVVLLSAASLTVLFSLIAHTELPWTRIFPPKNEGHALWVCPLRELFLFSCSLFSEYQIDRGKVDIFQELYFP